MENPDRERHGTCALVDIRNKTQAEWLRYFYFYGCGVSHPTAMFPRSVIEKVGLYNLGYVQVQDYDLWIRIAKYYPLHIIQKMQLPLVHYRHKCKRLIGEGDSTGKFRILSNLLWFL